MASWKIVESELIEWLKSYGGPRYHAVVSDPPYALISIAKRFGKAGSAPAQEGSDGRYSRLSKGFMSSKWDSFASLEHYQKWVSEWSELMIQRLLYPGAVCLFFGGTRTFHHLGVGLENGGFEIVDTMMWLHGSGFPKGHRQVTKMWDNVLKCQLSASAPLVVQVSKPIHLKSSLDTELTALALARILPEGDLALIVETGRAEDSHEVMVMSLSSLKGLGLTDLNMTSLWKKLSGVRYDAVNTFTTQTKISPTIVSKIWSFYQSANTQRDTHKVAILANGQLWYACNAVRDLSDESMKPSVIPILTVLGSVTENPVYSWSGHNVALKPSWEPVFVCRAPRRGLTRTWTFAELAVEFGTGALNIDGSRINTGGNVTFDREAGNRRKAEYRTGTVKGSPISTDQGRWPANLMLSHTDECVKVGEYIVDGRSINRWKSDMKPFGGGAGEEFESEQMPPDVIERYACVPGCPVRALDDQAGEHPAAKTPSDARGTESIFRPDQGGYQKQGPIYGDTGGPSRFFYTAKSSRSEKDKGLESFYWKRTDEGFERVSFEEYEKLEKKKRAHGCIHPTVKPLELLRYLSTLLLPPKQEGRIRRILIPFSGSGSEMIGATQAGWDEVKGIEMESNYVMMAEARIKATIGMF